MCYFQFDNSFDIFLEVLISIQNSVICFSRADITSRDSYTGRIQILVLTNCQAIGTEIGTDSLKI